MLLAVDTDNNLAIVGAQDCKKLPGWVQQLLALQMANIALDGRGKSIGKAACATRVLCGTAHNIRACVLMMINSNQSNQEVQPGVDDGTVTGLPAFHCLMSQL